MPFQYVNRQEKVFYISAKPGKNGKPRYSMTTKNTSTLVDAVPDGFEVYELPADGRTVLRKKVHSKITELEREALAQAIRKDAGIDRFLIDLEENAMIVYLTEMDNSNDSGSEWLRAVRMSMQLTAHYSKMMRFELESEKPHLFSVSRWCFLGSINSWFPLDYSKPLVTLIKKYVKHLGKESFFELM